MRNLRWVLNTLAKFRLDMITLTGQNIFICLKKGQTISSLLKKCGRNYSILRDLEFANSLRQQVEPNAGLRKAKKCLVL